MLFRRSLAVSAILLVSGTLMAALISGLLGNSKGLAEEQSASRSKDIAATGESAAEKHVVTLKNTNYAQSFTLYGGGVHRILEVSNRGSEKVALRSVGHDFELDLPPGETRYVGGTQVTAALDDITGDDENETSIIVYQMVP